MGAAAVSIIFSAGGANCLHRVYPCRAGHDVIGSDAQVLGVAPNRRHIRNSITDLQATDATAQRIDYTEQWCR